MPVRCRRAPPPPPTAHCLPPTACYLPAPPPPMLPAAARRRPHPHRRRPGASAMPSAAPSGPFDSGRTSPTPMRALPRYACAALERAELAGILLSSLRTSPTMMDINLHLDGTLLPPRVDCTPAQTVMLAVSRLRTGRPSSSVSRARVQPAAYRHSERA
ncbi:hypothetical protein AURDEDRAFT_166524 [Auricularia subglabra TFB-10046 SS5]|nr:hypothetical protein AURDEDRAFT_166524 [Auricularia subglabra TFB-10046 SS5]